MQITKRCRKREQFFFFLIFLVSCSIRFFGWVSCVLFRSCEEFVRGQIVFVICLFCPSAKGESCYVGLKWEMSISLDNCASFYYYHFMLGSSCCHPNTKRPPFFLIYSKSYVQLVVCAFPPSISAGVGDPSRFFYF